MRLPRVTIRRWVVEVSLVVVLILLAIWVVRPGLSVEWLGLDGLEKESPLTVIRQWAAGGLAPWTPFGFLSLFPANDLLMLGALVTAVVILVLMLSAPSRDSRLRPWHSQAIGELRVPRIRLRVRMILVLIAIVGLDLGWEIVTWREWHLSERYLAKSQGFASAAGRARDYLRYKESELARFEAGSPRWSENRLTPAARAAEQAYERNLFGQQLSYARDLVGVLAEVEQKYRAAADDPFRSVAADPPMPERPLDPNDWNGRKDYGRLVSALDDLIGRYPDLYRAHLRRASLLATCHDAEVRDGKEAVIAATRACDLSAWQYPDALATLAAAYAEAGDFARAVEYEQRAQEQLFGGRRLYDGTPWPAHVDWVPATRLALYKAGKPYHDPR